MEIGFTSPFWRLEFLGRSYVSEQSVHLCALPHTTSWRSIGTSVAANSRVHHIVVPDRR